ncbi:MAG: BamA/TamA family outer membrane protein [Burkholderiales bacterium]|nr:BamA/TamA family outer membrane protein [Burkholderiales bacterium]
MTTLAIDLLPARAHPACATLLALALMTLAVAQVLAQSELAAGPRFEIRAFRVDGATLLTPAEVDAATRPFVGASRSFADVQGAAAALEGAYAAKGYGAVQVLVPEQQLQRGEVVLKVEEARLGRVTVEGNRYFDDLNVRASIPALETGKAPNVAALARQLRVANENPSKQTTVLLKSGVAPGEVDAQVRVVDDRTQRFSLSVDNTGTPPTGQYRVGVGYMNANLWNRDHVLNAQYVTSPSKPGDVAIVAGSYRIPLYSLGDSIELFAAYSDVNSGVVQGLFNVAGKGTVVSGRYNRNLPRWGALESRIAFGADWRKYDSRVLPVGGTLDLVPDVIVHPLSAVWSGVYRRGPTETGLYGGYFRNIPGGPDGGQDTFDAIRPGATANYGIWRAGGNFVWAMPADFQFRGRMSFQYSPDLLVPGEQFGIGGIDSVRGFYEREVVGDRGYQGQAELYTPDVGNRIPANGVRVRALGFYDWGAVRRNDPVFPEIPRQGISSAGVGVRVGWRNNVSLRFDYAWVLQSAAASPFGEKRANFVAAFAY